jgi:hypothetical protein
MNPRERKHCQVLDARLIKRGETRACNVKYKEEGSVRVREFSGVVLRRHQTGQLRGGSVLTLRWMRGLVKAQERRRAR